MWKMIKERVLLNDWAWLGLKTAEGTRCIFRGPRRSSQDTIRHLRNRSGGRPYSKLYVAPRVSGTLRKVVEQVGHHNKQATYPHSRLSNSHSSIFLNLVSLKALMRAYSARPSWRESGSKFPIHPRSLGGRPGREERVFQVTKSGLPVANIPSVYNIICETSQGRHSLFVVCEFGRNRFPMCESAVQCIESMETVFGSANPGISPLREVCGAVGGEKRHRKGGCYGDKGGRGRLG